MTKTVIPLGYRVLVAQDKVEETTESGIILHHSTVTAERAATTLATVIAVGPRAWTDEGDESSKCKVGDRVMIRRYSGARVGEEEDSDILVNDQDIIARIE